VEIGEDYKNLVARGYKIGAPIPLKVKVSITLKVGLEEDKEDSI